MKPPLPVFYFAAIISITSCAHDKVSPVASKQEVRYGIITGIGRLEPERPLKTGMLGYHTGVNGDRIPEQDKAISVAAVAVFGTVVHFTGEAMGVRDRLRITVKLDNGELVKVVQKVRYTESFNEGDHVKVRGAYDVSH